MAGEIERLKRMCKAEMSHWGSADHEHRDRHCCYDGWCGAPREKTHTATERRRAPTRAVSTETSSKPATDEGSRWQASLDCRSHRLF